MNNQTLKTARISSCSTKKSSNKGTKSSSKTKKNLQNTFTKISIPSAVMANSSVLTQRINVHDKCKGSQTNPQHENTVRQKSSSKKLPKTISNMKLDRKAEYAKLKAKQMQSELQRKPSTGKKGFKKNSKSQSIATKQIRPIQETLNSIRYVKDYGKISNYLQPENDQTSQIKKNPDSHVLQEIQKNQKQLIQKISLLQKQNCNFSQRNDSVINQIKYKHQEEVSALKQEMKVLNSRLNQQGNKNTVLEKKVQHSQKDYVSLRQKLHEKDQRISFLQRQNKQLQQQLVSARDSINGYESQVHILQSNISNIKSVKTSIQQQLKKCEKQKQYIKQNCVQVLSILREQFGEELKLFSF